MYFFKDDSYYLFNGNKLDIEDGYPRLINDKWAFCPEHLLQSGSAHHATVQHGVVYVILAVCVALVMHLHL